MNSVKYRLIAGLGNPGEQYAGSRHNLGAEIISRLAESQGVALTNSSKLPGRLAWLNGVHDKTLLFQPELFYNNSGQAIMTAAGFYKISPPDILVIHDELALPFGTLRLRLGGSHSGNKGIKSLIDCLGEEFWRLRAGIAGPHRPIGDDTGFVLGRFTADERELLPDIAAAASKIALDFSLGRPLMPYTTKID